jgi:hypothetical protein
MQQELFTVAQMPHLLAQFGLYRHRPAWVAKASLLRPNVFQKIHQYV